MNSMGDGSQVEESQALEHIPSGTESWSRIAEVTRPLKRTLFRDEEDDHKAEPSRCGQWLSAKRLKAHSRLCIMSVPRPTFRRLNASETFEGLPLDVDDQKPTSLTKHVEKAENHKVDENRARLEKVILPFESAIKVPFFSDEVATTLVTRIKEKMKATLEVDRGESQYDSARYEDFGFPEESQTQDVESQGF